LAAALGLLAAGDREVQLLYAWAELSYEEISVALGLPIGTVRSRLHRARERIRGEFERAELSGFVATAGNGELLP
jgi:RNA polymerase sigma-70 factor (ECF subfamily)